MCEDLSLTHSKINKLSTECQEIRVLTLCVVLQRLVISLTNQEQLTNSEETLHSDSVSAELIFNLPAYLTYHPKNLHRHLDLTRFIASEEMLLYFLV